MQRSSDSIGAIAAALAKAQAEINNPGAARSAGKDIGAIVSGAISSAEHHSPTEDQPCCK